LKNTTPYRRSLGTISSQNFKIGLKKVEENPRFFHFDQSGLRRCNLDRFPYHFLYDVRENYVRVWVLRYNGRDPKFGLRRFDR
jgi:hypothetical protein